MLLTLGMATHNDFHGVAFTIQALSLYQDLTDCEIVVVDNAPDSKHGQETKRLCMDLAGRSLGPVRYIPMPVNHGTTQTRQRIFEEARGDGVLVMDCHVLFRAGAIARLKRYLADNPDSKDILSGPLLLNHLTSIHTHFNDQWRGGMWGTWGSAYRCTCGDPLYFTTIQRGETVEYADLATSRRIVEECAGCGKNLPPHPWAAHEANLARHGFQPLGMGDDDPPFEIPGMGLGVFGCRREAWPGFHPHFRGFGGEEMYIHEKVRRAGGRAICLSFLKWWHRFGRPDGTGYVNRNYDRVRNYVLGYQELGLSLDPIHRQFVSLDTFGASPYEHLRYEHGDSDERLKGKNDVDLERIHRSHKLRQEDWEWLLADPLGRPNPIPVQAKPPTNLDTGRPQPPAGASLDEIFDWCKGVKRDLDQHLLALRALAEKCDHVTELTKRRESTVAFLAGRPKQLISYQTEKDILLVTLDGAVKADRGHNGRKIDRHVIHWGADSLQINAIDETDLLFIDTVHTSDRLSAELGLHGHRVRRFIVLRGTGANGERGEGEGTAGLFHALRPWLQKHPEWFIAWHTDAEYGMTALGRLPEDRPARPVHAWAPGYGPGTELKRLLAIMDITPSVSCDCNAKAVLMDKWGVEGCRENRDTIVGWLREGAPRWKWTDRLAAAAKAVKSGLAFQLNPLDPFGSLVDEAIRAAEGRR